jgi:hypothetical protein
MRDRAKQLQKLVAKPAEDKQGHYLLCLAASILMNSGR